jgi:hypothetical protein
MAREKNVPNRGCLRVSHIAAVLGDEHVRASPWSEANGARTDGGHVLVALSDSQRNRLVRLVDEVHAGTPTQQAARRLVMKHQDEAVLPCFGTDEPLSEFEVRRSAPRPRV